MVCLRLFILFGTCIGLAFSITTHNLFYLFWAQFGIISHLQNKCPRNETNGTDLFELLQESWDCVSSYSQTNESFCETYETVIQDCSESVVDHLNNCVPEGLNDFPQSLVDTIVSVMGAVCTSTGELLLEVLHDCLIPDGNNAILKKYCDKEKLDKNMKKIDEPKSTLEICQGVTEIGNCWKNFVNHNCPSPKTKEFAKKFLDAFLTTCRT